MIEKEIDIIYKIVEINRKHKFHHKKRIELINLISEDIDHLLFAVDFLLENFRDFDKSELRSLN